MSFDWLKIIKFLSRTRVIRILTIDLWLDMLIYSKIYQPMYLLNHPVIYVSIYLITYRPMALWLISH